MFLDRASVVPLHFEAWSRVQVKDAKMTNSFFGCNFAACGPIEFKYTPQCFNSEAVILVVLHTARFRALFNL